MWIFDIKLSMDNPLQTVQIAIHRPREDPRASIHMPWRPMDDDDDDDG